MKIGRTGRGFQIVKFNDRNGAPISLQQSSAADYNQPGSSAIWFGPVNADPMVLVPGHSWQPVPFPEGTLFTTRAHLDLKTVKKLIPLLQAWVETGYFKPPRSKAVVAAKTASNSTALDKSVATT